MIDKHQASKDTEQAEYIRRLRRSYNFFEKLCTVSQACQTTFRWLEVNRAEPMPLLDFDVICGALPSMAIEQHLESSALHSEEDVLLLRDMPGPYTIRNVLSGIGGLYLPQGTVADFLSWKERKTGTLTAKARRFVRKLNWAAASSEPKSIFMRRQFNEVDLISILRDEISVLSGLTEDLSQLERIVDKAATVDYSPATSSHPRSAKAFQTTLQELNRLRPDKPKNNFNDAMNVAEVVHIYNQSIRKREKRFGPVLISQTKYIVKIEAHGDWFPGLTKDLLPGFFNDNLYLVVSQGIRSRSSGNYYNMRDLAMQLHEIAGEIVPLFSDILVQARESEKKETKLVLPEHEMDMLRFKLREFDREWGSLFGPVILAESHDKAAYLNAMLSPEVTQLVRAPDAASVRRGIARLKSTLLNYEHPLKEIFRMSYSDETRRLADLSTAISSVFSYQVGGNDGTLLSRMPNQLQVLEDVLAGQSVQGLRKKRVLVRVNPFLSTVFGVDFWDGTAEQDFNAVTIVWIHGSQFVDIWEEGLSLFDHYAAPNVISYRICSQGTSREGEERVSRLKELAKGLLSEGFDPDYFELSDAKQVFFADVKPIEVDETMPGFVGEMQAGSVFDHGKWTEQYLMTLSKTMSRTSATRLPKMHYYESLKHLGKQVGIIRTNGRKRNQ
jgi:hypothetical protein